METGVPVLLDGGADTADGDSCAIGDIGDIGDIGEVIDCEHTNRSAGSTNF